jgi:glycerol-3-phosphate dehydrogenase subunit C
MPQLENGNIERVAESASKISRDLEPYIEEGYDVIALTPSCTLMLKFEWPLLLPEVEGIRKLASSTFDITEYVVDIAKKEDLAEGLTGLDGGVALHMACHARAQNIGAKAAEMLRFLPEADVKVIERCSGHGGSWGILKNNFETGIKVGRTAARQTASAAKAASEKSGGTAYIASECPLAGEHILQGIERLKMEGKPEIPTSQHPIELFAQAYGLL